MFCREVFVGRSSAPKIVDNKRERQGEELPTTPVVIDLVCWLDTMDGEFHNEAENILPDPEEDLELTGCAVQPCCNPSHTLHRFMALLLMCLLGFGK